MLYLADKCNSLARYLLIWCFGVSRDCSKVSPTSWHFGKFGVYNDLPTSKCYDISYPIPRGCFVKITGRSNEVWLLWEEFVSNFCSTVWGKVTISNLAKDIFREISNCHLGLPKVMQYTCPFADVWANVLHSFDFSFYATTCSSIYFSDSEISLLVGNLMRFPPASKIKPEVSLLNKHVNLLHCLLLMCHTSSAAFLTSLFWSPHPPLPCHCFPCSMS